MFTNWTLVVVILRNNNSYSSECKLELLVFSLSLESFDWNQFLDVTVFVIVFTGI